MTILAAIATVYFCILSFFTGCFVICGTLDWLVDDYCGLLDIGFWKRLSCLWLGSIAVITVSIFFLLVVT